MTIQIKQRFEVAGEIFDTLEEAEAYLATAADSVRVEAFFDWYKENRGAQRISQTSRDMIHDFIRFEAGEPSASQAEEEEEPSDLDEATEIVAEGLAEGETLATEPEATAEPKPSIFAAADAEAEEEEASRPAGKSLFGV